MIEVAAAISAINQPSSPYPLASGTEINNLECAGLVGNGYNMSKTIQQDKIWSEAEALEVARFTRKLIADKELEDFSRFVNANPRLTVKEAFEAFEVLKDIPF